METQAGIYKEDELEINIPAILREWFHHWWIILLCGCILGMWFYMGVSFLKAPLYVSETTLVVKNDEKNNYSYSANNTEKLISQYTKVLTSNVLKNAIMEDLGVSELPGSLSASVIDGTNLISLKGMAAAPGDAYRIVKAALANYDKVSAYVLSAFSLEVMEKASIPTSPVNARTPLKYGLLGVFMGACGAAALIALITMLHDDIKDEKSVARLLDTTLFASLYYEKKRKSSRKKGILINDPATSFIYSENIKKMATKLEYRAQKNDQKVFVITSVNENEGKSTVAANLALALADREKNVLLVDCDFRKPALYKIFDKKIDPQTELGGFIRGENDVQHSLQFDKKTGIYYLFGTKKYQNTDEFLTSKKLKKVFESSKKIVDYIIIDTPPTRIAPDAEIIAEYADGVLMVVRQGGARVADINDSLDSLKKAGAMIYGCVLNGIQTQIIPTKTGSYHYGYGGKYGKYENKYEHKVHKNSRTASRKHSSK